MSRGTKSSPKKKSRPWKLKIQIEIRVSPPRQRRTASLFLEHLFKAALTSSDTKSAIPVKGKLYEAYCIRDATGVTQMIVKGLSECQKY